MTDSSSKAFTFVQGLAADLQQGEIELPAFPDVVNRLRIILVDPNSSAKDVVEVIAVDPILTTRLMKMANSAALNPKGIKIENLDRRSVASASISCAPRRPTRNCCRTTHTSTSLKPGRPVSVVTFSNHGPCRSRSATRSRACSRHCLPERPQTK